MIKSLWLFKKSTFLILLTSLGLVSGLFIFLFYKKIDESKNSISSYIQQREYELAENILENKNTKATSDAFMVLKSFNTSAYEVYYSKKLVFNWPDNSSQILASCDRPFEADVTFRGILVGPVKTCLATSALIQGTFSTTTFAFAFVLVLILFAVIALQPLMGYKKSLNTTIDTLKKWNENPSLTTPLRSEDRETNKIIELLSAGVEARVELSEVQTQLGMEKEVSRFIKTLAHDLREPIYNHQSNINILKEKIKLKEYNFLNDDLLDVLSTNNQRVQDILSDLMETHKRESQFISQQIELIDIVPICQELVKGVMRFNTNVSFEIVAPSELLLKVNRKDFKRVFANLIKNGIEALDKNSKSIKVSIIQKNTEALVLVEDNGKGIALHDLPKVFDEHFSKGKIHGNGLGLYYVKKKVNSWGGNISIDSFLGKGTTVRIQFLETGLQS